MSGTFLHQKVNSYLCIALIGLMTFWTCLYYFVHKAEAFGTQLGAMPQLSHFK